MPNIPTIGVFSSPTGTSTPEASSARVVKVILTETSIRAA